MSLRRLYEWGLTTDRELSHPTKAALLHTPDQADVFRGLVMPIRITPAGPKKEDGVAGRVQNPRWPGYHSPQ
ncbi:hypothetical protein ABZ471_42470 [Streptomyces sp. NPDC005728]|uniref:hypothetical protein n=1 Tax=Streptomyces sp. NPDC005728 TaxID=3157054 RepID=UPI0033F920D1